MYKFFILLLINYQLFAFLNANTDFSNLPAELQSIYDQLYIFIINNSDPSTCTSTAISPNQLILTQHCYLLFQVNQQDFYNLYQNINYIIIQSHDFIYEYPIDHKLMLFPNQDLSATYTSNLDINNLFPIYFNYEYSRNIILITINKSEKVDYFKNFFNQANIIKTKAEYCNYFDDTCTYLKPNKHLYVFGIRNARTKCYLPNCSKNNPIIAHVPEWVDVVISENNKKDFRNILKRPNSYYLQIRNKYIQSESGDSGGPYFICEYIQGQIMAAEKNCKMIAIHEGQHVKGGIIANPIFDLTDFSENHKIPAMPNIYQLNTCQEFINHTWNDYIYFWHDNIYYRFKQTSVLESLSFEGSFSSNLKFNGCDNDALKFNDLKNNKDVFINLKSLHFYDKNNTVSTDNIIKFMDCTSFNDSNKDHQPLMFYTYKLKAERDGKFNQGFYRIDQPNAHLLLFDNERFEWHNIDGLKFEICTHNEDKLDALKFANIANKVIYIPLYKIIFYKTT